MRQLMTGFSLIELIVTISVMAVVATMATATYTSVITGTRMSGEINELMNGLNLARSEAIKRGQIIDVCPLNGAVCATGTNWNSAWTILIDSTAQQLKVVPAVTHGDNLSSTISTFPQMTPAGYTFFTGTLTLHDVNSTQGLYRCIVFNAGSWTTQRGAACP